YIDVQRMLYAEGYYNNWINNREQLALTPVVELLIQQDAASDQASKAAIDQQISALAKADVRRDFDRYFYQPAWNQQYALTLDGGSNELAWHVLAGHDRNRSNLDARYNRTNLKANIQYRPIQQLSF